MSDREKFIILAALSYAISRMEDANLYLRENGCDERPSLLVGGKSGRPLSLAELTKLVEKFK